MKLTINTDILQKHSLSLGEFLALLMSHLGISYADAYDSIISKGLAEANLFKEHSAILSDNSHKLVSGILIESDEKIVNSNIDFDVLANKLQQFYPTGCKTGTSHSWRGDTEEIAQLLRKLVVKYDFPFTCEEAINAVNEYVSQFEAPYQHMLLLRNFILTVKLISKELHEINSVFMTIIEKNRKNESNT